MFYRAFRTVVAWLMAGFYRLEPPRDPLGGLTHEGPIIFVGNHPNGLVDPALLFALVKRHVTFLAKAPLFAMPVLGSMLKAMDALPVFRKQEGADTAKNESTLTASVDALVAGRAITIFPEGKSHSEPQLAELKTGCARIALDAVSKGAAVKIVPVGLNYAEKARFRSQAWVDVGVPIDAREFTPREGEEMISAARRLTTAIADSLRAVTLNLEKWDDLPIVETAEALYALKTGQDAQDQERTRAFARGLSLLREEQPERFEGLKARVRAFSRRMGLVKAEAKELTFQYRPATVVWFAVKNTVALVLGLPLFLLGMVLFALPFWIPKWVVLATKPEIDTEATFKVLTTLVLAPFWWALLTVLGFWWGGVPAGMTALLGTVPLALFTRYYLEQRTEALADVRTFFVLISRSQLKARLLSEGEALATEIEQVANELRARVIS